MKSVRICFCVIAVVLSFAGCKKNKTNNMVINGIVTDASDHTSVPGAKVKIYYKPFQNGVFMTTFSLLTSTTADASGNYTFDIEKPNTSDFKFVVEKEGYFDFEKVVNPDNLSIDNDNTLNLEASASCLVTFHFKNTSPFDGSDYFEFNANGVNYTCSTCCANSAVVKTGTTVDTTYACLRYGGRYLKYQYLEVKNGATNLQFDSVFCPKGGSIPLDIFY